MILHKKLTKRIALLLATAIVMTGMPLQTSAEEFHTEENTELIVTDEVSEDAIPVDTESDNEADENTTVEETVSIDEIISEVEEVSENSISENVVSGNETAAAAAREALQELTTQKKIMALIYMAATVDVKEKPSEDSATQGTLKSGVTVLLQDFAVSENRVWYQVQSIEENTEIAGYVPRENLAYSDEEFLAWEATWLDKLLDPMVLAAMEEAVGASTYDDISLFPSSYHSALNKLKSSHPNWKFVVYDSGIDWNSAVTAQKGERSYISSSAPSEYKDGATGQANWYYASKAAIQYYMDPRNTLTENYIFQNEQLTYNATYHTQDAVQKIISGTFMSGSIPSDSEGRTYAQAFFNIGKSLNMSPIHLAARVRQEQGISGSSALISGTYSGYEGYYNYFNIKASGSTSAEVIKNGLAYAKSQGWNTRYKALKGGAEFLNNGYISVGQDTLYLQKFDLVGTPYTHQYMQNIQAPYTEGKSTRDGYSNAGTLNNGFVFKIAVYDNMPNEEPPLKLNKSSLKIKNIGDTYTFQVYESGSEVANTSVTWASSEPTIATISNEGVLTALAVGKTKITITNKDGDTASCTVTVENQLRSVSLNTLQVSLERGEVYTLDLSYDPVDTSDDRTVTWKTSNSKVATLVTRENGDGINDIVTFRAGIPGTATITATVGSFKVSCEVTVTAYLKSVSLNKTEMTVFSGGTQRLTASYLPVYTSDDTTITWSSSDESIAEVEAGVVTGKQSGNVVITASMSSASGARYEASCQVQVRECIVTFYDLQGVKHLSTTKAYGEQLGELPELTVSGNYEFSGWYTMKEGMGSKYDSESVVKGDLYLYPYFMETDKGFFVKAIGNQTYTGSAIKPQVFVYDKDKLLVANVDYKVSYKNNKKVNDTSVINKTPTVTVTGKGNYKGTETVSFHIVKADLADKNITAQDLLVAYNGSRKLLSPVVKQGAKKLVKNKDYVLSYPLSAEEGAYIQPGVYPIIIQGIGNYEGSITVNEVITNKVLASKLSVAKIPNQVYAQGEKIEPHLTVKNKGILLVEGSQYTVSYTNNVEIGTATATIRGIESAGYIGTKSITFKITGQDIRKVKVDGVSDLVYDNRQAEQGITQSGYALYGLNGVGELVEGVDYTVSYLKNQKVGTATIVFTGIGKYNQVLKKKFKIQKAVLTESENAPFVVEYEKGGAKPEPIVSMNGILLQKGVDYTVKYSNNNTVNDGSDSSKLPQILITGKGNYQGKITRTFYIEAKNFAAVQVTALDGVFSEQAGKFIRKPVVTDTNGKVLKAGTDYEAAVVYTYVEDVVMADGTGTVKHAGDRAEKTDVPPAGTLIRVSVTGRGNYTLDTISCVYRVAAASIAKASVKVLPQEYTGQAVTLSYADITVKYTGAGELTAEDYVILTDTYQKNIAKGTATVVIQGRGNYGGQKKISFRILPKILIWWWRI